MKCIIIDDEPLAREGIELDIQTAPYLKLIGQFEDAISANDFLAKNEVDLIFLDIQMPGMTGLDFIRSLKNKPLTIITTAYPEFALEGFELDVVDYLVKPIRLHRFIKATNKAREIFELSQSAKDNKASIEEDFVYIKSERKYIKLFFKDIKYIKGLKDYVMIFSENDKVMTAMNIKTINAHLPENTFVRVSKSHIININFIKAVDIDCIYLSGKEIPLGRTYKDHFVKHYINTNLVKR